MNSKKRRLFLGISFTIFAFSVIAVIASIIASYYKIQADFHDDSIMAMSEFAFGAFFVMLIAIPFWGAALSFIRSVYKILKHRLKKNAKICYVISFVVAFLAIAFLVVSVSFEIFDTGSNLTANIPLVTEWPAFILSFVLGSIPIKQ